VITVKRVAVEPVWTSSFCRKRETHNSYMLPFFFSGLSNQQKLTFFIYREVTVIILIIV
jgi:hypothetical protein